MKAGLGGDVPEDGGAVLPLIVGGGESAACLWPGGACGLRPAAPGPLPLKYCFGAPFAVNGVRIFFSSIIKGDGRFTFTFLKTCLPLSLSGSSSSGLEI